GDCGPPDNRNQTDRPLTHCGACAAEVRGLRETAARLALNVAERPPAPMRGRVMAAAQRPRQVPPIPDPRPPRSGVRPIRSARSARRARRKWIAPISATVAAASVALAVVFGLAQNSTNQHLSAIESQLGAAPTHNQQLDSVLA